MAPLAMAAIPAVLGAVGSYKSAKDAKKQAAKGVNSTETTTRTPYGPATSHIQTILDAAASQYGAGQQGPMPYAWQQFLNNPTGGAPAPGGGGGGAAAGGGGGGANLNWRGKDRAQVQAAKAERQQARHEARNAPSANPEPQGGQMQGGQAAGGPAPSGPQFQQQQGPFGYSQGIRDLMMNKYQQQGVQGYQPAMNYIQALLGGQSQNPYLSQAFSRLQGQTYNPNSYFSSFQAPPRPPGGPVDPGFLGGNGI